MLDSMVRRDTLSLSYNVNCMHAKGIYNPRKDCTM